MRILIASEVFPPRAGGAGWSARELALGLRAAGHAVSVVTTSPGPDTEDGLRVERLRVRGRKRFTAPRAFAAVTGRFEGDVVHAQHSLSALGCLAGPGAGRVAVTIRDHWPFDIPSTLPYSEKVLDIFLSFIPKGAPWFLTRHHSKGWESFRAALELGGHVRVGYQDGPFLASGKRARSNAELVEEVSKAAHTVGRKVVGPARAREMLGLKPLR